jgi:hypothetical protein
LPNDKRWQVRGCVCATRLRAFEEVHLSERQSGRNDRRRRRACDSRTVSADSRVNPLRFPFLRVVAFDPILPVLALFPFETSVPFFSFLAAVAHRFSPHFRVARETLPAPETLPDVPPPEKPQVPDEEPPVTPPLTDPPPDPKTDPTAIDPDDAQMAHPEDGVFKTTR